MAKMKICKDCGAEVSKSARTCPKCGKDLTYPVLRGVLLAFFIIIIVGIIVNPSDNNTTQTGTDIVQNQEKITLEKFNKIETGMTYQEVVDIVGEEGTVISETDIMQDEKYKTIMYCWYASNGIANANVTFQGGKVVSKAQLGLE